MTGASGAGSVAGSPLPKWQLALAVGAPVALGLGYMYYKNSTKPSSKPSRGKSKGSKENGTPADRQISIDGECTKPVKPTTPETETPLGKAQRFKSQGNDLFKTGKYDEAIAQYNNAIDACPKENIEELATFYQNRAAAYDQLKKYSAVKADCTKALELHPKYVKALLRRARALEHCNDLQAALEDVIAVCILESFSNQTALLMANRILKQLGRQHAEEYLPNKKFVMPRKYFIKTYINTFHTDPVFSKLENLDEVDAPPGYKMALQALKEQKYEDIIPLCTEELNNSETDEQPLKMELLLLRATFHLLLGQHDNAIEDFETVIDNEASAKGVKVNALIKRATLYMRLEDPEKSFSDFQRAAELDPDCHDIYHQRGQVNLLMENIDEAKEDFKKAVDLNPTFGVAYVQKCYADYRYGITKRNMELIAEAVTNFEKAFDKFPDCADCYTLYAQVLSDMQQYEKADSFFAKSLKKDPNDATVYVHRGLLQLQWNGNMEKAVEYIKEALALDDKCEFGYETLGTIEFKRENFKEAVELFDKALSLSRTAMEITHIFSLIDAAKAQITVRERLGSDVPWNLQNVS